MGISSAWSAWRRGESWEKTFGYLYVSEAEIKRGLDADNKLDALNRQAFESGKWTGDQYAGASARAAETSMDALLTDPQSSPWAGFQEGLAEGKQNVQDTIKAGLSSPIQFGLGSIPWEIWALALAWGAWKLGLLDKLLKK